MREPFKQNRDARIIEACEQYVSSGEQFESRIETAAKCISCALDRLKTLKGYNNMLIEYDIKVILLENGFCKRLKYSKYNRPEIFFVEFSNKGDVVVVGAGYDMTRFHNKSNLNWRILEECGLEWSDKALLINVYGLKQSEGHKNTGSKGCDHILQCRNGVETYIGESLIDGGIKILNRYSHWNYVRLNKSDWNRKMQGIFEEPSFYVSEEAYEKNKMNYILSCTDTLLYEIYD